MKFYLLKMKVKGIKNIDKEITLEFYNKILKDKFDLNNSNIKSIYGSNGTGKSAIVNAIDIYQNLILNENYLSDSKSLIVLNELINKKLGMFSFEVSSLCYDENTMQIIDTFTHRIEIVKDSSNLFSVAYEKIVLHQGKKYEDNGKTLLEIKNGKIIYSDFKNEYKSILLAVINLLEKQSVSTILFKKHETLALENEKEKRFNYRLLLPMLLAVNLNITLNDTDRHTNYLMMQEEVEAYIENMLTNIYVNTGTDIIVKKKYDQYQENVKKMYKFIKLFKTNLKSIDIEVKEDSDVLVCRKYFNYGDYRVESEFESTGIKKLITLYKAFYDLNNGKIVFIDELDANLHNVYLCKLLEYFSTYCDGQLCFTTHNLAPMEILKKRNYSIDFLSDDSTITSWKKNGNYSVSKLYKEGMIQNSPFNIESFDFLGLFDEE